ncbi:hypothetical protein GCM10007856_43480 [Azospirillum oryzae]|nr:hypothetical protein GCM10007856_43480 [Azospirillum oryzae]
MESVVAAGADAAGVAGTTVAAPALSTGAAAIMAANAKVETDERIRDQKTVPDIWFLHFGERSSLRDRA